MKHWMQVILFNLIELIVLTVKINKNMCILMERKLISKQWRYEDWPYHDDWLFFATSSDMQNG